jgi:hypothetical protein
MGHMPGRVMLSAGLGKCHWDFVKKEETHNQINWIGGKERAGQFPFSLIITLVNAKPLKKLHKHL